MLYLLRGGTYQTFIAQLQDVSSTVTLMRLLKGFQSATKLCVRTIVQESDRPLFSAPPVNHNRLRSIGITNSQPKLNLHIVISDLEKEHLLLALLRLGLRTTWVKRPCLGMPRRQTD